MKLRLRIIIVVLFIGTPIFSNAQDKADAWTRIARPGYEEYAPVTLANGVYGITLSEKALQGNRVQLNGIFDEFPDKGVESALQAIDFTPLELIVMDPEAQQTEQADFLKGKSFSAASLDQLENWQQEFNFREGWFRTNFNFEGLSVEHTVYALKHMLQTGIIKVTIRAQEDRFFSIKNELSIDHPYVFQSSQYLNQLRERQIPLLYGFGQQPDRKVHAGDHHHLSLCGRKTGTTLHRRRPGATRTRFRKDAPPGRKHHLLPDRLGGHHL